MSETLPAAPAPPSAIIAEDLPRWILRKGNIPSRWLLALAVIGTLPLLTAALRILGLPGMLDSGSLFPGFLADAGRWLNHHATLQWVPVEARWTVMYVVMLPAAAFIIAIARLTFGLRVLGFRSILLSVGFWEIGVLPSLALVATVATAIVALRPAMRRARLPLYARVAVVLGVTAMVMAFALLLGPWTNSPALWSVAFFPVIILAMLAEGIAKSIEEESDFIAAWRTFWTIVVGLLIFGVSYATPLPLVLLAAPELELSLMVGVILVAEFYDFRLLEAWARSFRVGARAQRERKEAGAIVVAIVRNRWSNGVIGRLGSAAPLESRAQSVDAIADVLRDRGYDVRVLEGDSTLGRELRRVLTPDPRTGSSPGLVLNLATGIQGRGRLAHVPAMLESLGIPYSGPDPLCHALISDRRGLFLLMSEIGVPTPPHAVITEVDAELPARLTLPVLVRAHAATDADPIVARTQKQFRRALATIIAERGEPAFVESELASEEIRVTLLGGREPTCLPLVLTRDGERRRLCPAPIAMETAQLIETWARRAYARAGCRDYARIDFRFRADGTPCLIRIETQRVFARNGTVALAAERGGYSYGELLDLAIDSAWRRYLSTRHGPLNSAAGLPARRNTAVGPDTPDKQPA